ncbi:hypothetical protein B0H66DRAFT_18438 [Apodospora peruviana]|uniref:Uncharacterized protein n=1 Tax=Apodospora peruviana TaxID=516989 RepID=A0AAE0MEJ2_9PEZI|nr:hypothetical protein B0H66DRAFT_18438 [Apodospora peruviana]
MAIDKRSSAFMIHTAAATMTAPTKSSKAPRTLNHEDSAGLPVKKRKKTVTEGPINCADRNSELLLNRTFTHEFRCSLCHETLRLMRKRELLLKELAHEPKIDTPSQRLSKDVGLLRRLQQIEKREARHLAVRTKALSQLERLYKLHPSPKRATDLFLVKSLLQKFTRHLALLNSKMNYGDKQRNARFSSERSHHRTTKSGDSDKSPPSKPDSEETVSGTKRKLEPVKAEDRGQSTKKALAKSPSPSRLNDIEAPVKKKIVLHVGRNPNELGDKAATKEDQQQSAPASATDTRVKAKVKTSTSVSGALGVDKSTTSDGERKRKKRHRDDEVDDPKPKKTKSEPGTGLVEPASSKVLAASAQPPPITRSSAVHERRVHQMLTDPLGFDDLVYDDTRRRPKPKMKRGRNHNPNFPLLMSGGLGLPKNAKVIQAKPKAVAVQVSRNMLKKNHSNKVAERVDEMKNKVTALPTSTLGKIKISEGSKQHEKDNHQQSARNQKYSTSTYSDVPTMSGAVAANARDKAPLPQIGTNKQTPHSSSTSKQKDTRPRRNSFKTQD